MFKAANCTNKHVVRSKKPFQFRLYIWPRLDLNSISFTLPDSSAFSWVRFEVEKSPRAHNNQSVCFMQYKSGFRADSLCNVH